MNDVLIIGGGAVGLCCAHYLERAGMTVEILEGGTCGAATSSGNAGWVTRSLSEPLPAPGVMWQALKWMLKADSPLHVRPRADRRFANWSWMFYRHCSATAFSRGSEALVDLNRDTLTLFDELHRETGGFEIHHTGLLFVSLTGEALDDFTEMLRGVQRAGFTDRIESFDRASVLEFEPALNRSVVGGLYVRSERHVRPETFTQALVSSLRSRGVLVSENEPVVSLAKPLHGHSWRVCTARRQIETPKLVVAAGAWSAPLLESVDIKLPLEPAKGYSVTSAKAENAPSHPLYLTEAKVGLSPFADEVRLAGTMELSGYTLSLNQQRIAPIVAAASSYLRAWRPSPEAVLWAGLRPLPPDGLPYIGRFASADGLYVATGHSHLGITLAPATGSLLADLITSGEIPSELEPFSPDRLSRRRTQPHQR